MPGECSIPTFHFATLHTEDGKPALKLPDALRTKWSEDSLRSGQWAKAISQFDRLTLALQFEWEFLGCRIISDMDRNKDISKAICRLVVTHGWVGNIRVGVWQTMVGRVTHSCKILKFSLEVASYYFEGQWDRGLSRLITSTTHMVILAIPL